MLGSGGKKALGYVVMEAPHHYNIVGHAVWEGPDGQLYDPTPIGKSKQTYFLLIRTTTNPDHHSISALFEDTINIWKTLKKIGKKKKKNGGRLS